MSDSEEFESADEETSNIDGNRILVKTPKPEETPLSCDQLIKDNDEAKIIKNNVDAVDDSIISNEIKKLDIKNDTNSKENNELNDEQANYLKKISSNNDVIHENVLTTNSNTLDENMNVPHLLVDKYDINQKLLSNNFTNIPKVTSPIKNDSPLIGDSMKAQAPTLFNFWGSSSNSLSFIKSNVVKNINSMIESVEQKLAIPSPEALANTPIIKSLELNEDSEATNSGYFVKSLTDVGKKFVTGGYETLEKLGKKTFEVLDNSDLVDKEFQDNKIKLFDNSNKTSLSDLLKEAQTYNETETENNRNFVNEDLRVSIEELIDEDQGCVQVQALEMLSKRCNEKIIKMQNLIKDKDAIIPESFGKIGQLFDMGLSQCENQLPKVTELSDINFVENLTNILIKLNLKTTSIKIIQTYDTLVKTLDQDYSRENCAEILKSLSKFVCSTIECLHKIGQSLLIDKKISKKQASIPQKLPENAEENDNLAMRKASSIIDLTKLVVDLIQVLPTQIRAKAKDARVDDGLKQRSSPSWESETNYCLHFIVSATRHLGPICQLKDLESFLENLS